MDVRGEGVVWSYELSKTWSGNSKAVVEHLRSTTEPSYEVECELVDEKGEYRSSHTEQEMASSLLLKASLLLGDEDKDKIKVLETWAKKRKRKGSP